MTDPRRLRADLLAEFDARLDAWEDAHGAFAPSPLLAPDAGRLAAATAEFLDRLTAPPTGPRPGMYPFGHPRFAGQMLKPPHPVALAAHAAVARINPNNHALDGGPPTSAMEREAVSELAVMLGFPADALGHLTGGGTVANLEALFVAREQTRGTPRRAVAVGAEAHYTHARMAHVLGLDVVPVASDARGRMDLDALEDALRAGTVGTVVLTAGTTGIGAVDPLAEAIPLCRRHGARVHVDAAYGGFFSVLARPDAPGVPADFPAEHFAAIGQADSVVVDPHKHGLQPYGCGAVIFSDSSVARHYVHESAYTYFTSASVHLGEISLECSRPGASAAALWLTLRALPLRADDGLGPALAASLRAARALADGLGDRFRVLDPPQTDIVVYAPRAASAAATDALAGRMFDLGMADPHDPLFLSLYRVAGERLGLGGGAARVLRSVLMKPEHEAAVPWIADRLDTLLDLALDGLAHVRP